jgi:hypothetical protein
MRQSKLADRMRSYKKLDCGLLIFDEIIRQKDPTLKEAVEQLARGEVREAIGNLNSQGRVLEIKDREERIGEIAREYVRSPERSWSCRRIMSLAARSINTFIAQCRKRGRSAAKSIVCMCCMRGRT